MATATKLIAGLRCGVLDGEPRRRDCSDGRRLDQRVLQLGDVALVAGFRCTVVHQVSAKRAAHALGAGQRREHVVAGQPLHAGSVQT
jgi:hypothetical protein